jgi:hypothetical protein
MAFPVRFVAEGQTVQTTSRELDDEGVWVRCVEPPAVGERVVLRLYLPGIEAGDAIQAEIIEASADGFRARFQDMLPEAREHVQAALDGAAEAVEAPAATARAGENRRFLPRFLDRFRVTLAVGQHKAQRDVLNLSAAGLFIHSEAPPEIDQIVQVILELPDGKPPAEVQAIVLRRVLPGGPAAPGAGVQFIAADDEFRTRLDAYLDRLRTGRGATLR